MFTGIIQEVGAIDDIAAGGGGFSAIVRAGKTARGIKPGGSLAVNGCCLTATKISRRGGSALVRFDLLAETWSRTTFPCLKKGSLVNLERPLRAGEEFGGHFVTGHIDGIGKIVRWEKAGGDHVLHVAAAKDIMRYVVEKGSIAVDGISLTVAGAGKERFRVRIIPYTLQHTALKEKKRGDKVNLEADVIGKYALAGR
ncbi:MAG: riboflavin synthase [Verrucomicrobia bacterium]|nr:riboflavin synthase [Verrucomicrobiota bacterium]MDE3099148.1 riboflavin synthase [Verrucomicrobiota bacterium]